MGFKIGLQSYMSICDFRICVVVVLNILKIFALLVFFKCHRCHSTEESCRARRLSILFCAEFGSFFRGVFKSAHPNSLKMMCG